MASRQRKDKKVTHAFTVKWIWAWAIMHGHKTAEYRHLPPEVLRGRCAVHELFVTTRKVKSCPCNYTPKGV